MSWLAGTLELTSKVRYGLTSRGVPLFRFMPYDKRFGPFAVGCSMRDLSTNQHVIVEGPPIHKDHTEKQQEDKPQKAYITLPKANLIQNLGKPTLETEKLLLLTTYAYDSTKELRRLPDVGNLTPGPGEHHRIPIRDGFTFHIDPPGCRDVDDSFTFIRCVDYWKIAIHIADVASWIPAGSSMDTFASRRTTTFYSHDGKALAPMLPPAVSEGEASLIVGYTRPTLSLVFRWRPGSPPIDFRFMETYSQTSRAFTYETAHAEQDSYDELQALRDLATQLGADPGDTHTWVAALMILYNEHAGKLLHSYKKGILRRHSTPKAKRLEFVSTLNDPSLLFLAYDAAEYCLATDEATHYGLGKDVYAYASSPLRRYADLVNQRLIKAALHHTINESAGPSIQLVEHLNRRQKQAKAFTRDMFFASALSVTSMQSVRGRILEKVNGKTHIWVPEWKRIIKTSTQEGEGNDHVRISWYDNRECARWKERMVFRLEPVTPSVQV